ncbi:MAG: glycerophosphodiester phosphodiesterase [Pseudomonadota bacterium]
MEVIAHRGASGYLPEHTLPAKALAHAMGADYLEQDVVASRDGQLVVLHDIHVDRVTDVAERFPARCRDDGRYYAIDFTMDELRTLTVNERCDADGKAVYPNRYPVERNNFRLHTLDEEIRFIRGLNRSTGRSAGIYPEIKKPAWHKQEGIDLSVAVIETLLAHGYRSAEDPVYLQCFDAAETRRIRVELQCDMKLVQLIGENSWNESATNYDALRTGAGLQMLLKYADAVGPRIQHLYLLDSSGTPVASQFALAVRSSGVACHPYTLRADELPAGFKDVATLVTFLQKEARVNGVFADHPDLAKVAINRR